MSSAELRSPGALPPVALLAGGLATRMRPLTQTIAKAMLEVAGEPFVAHQLRALSRHRVEKVVICAGYLAQQIEEFVGDGGAFGLAVTYSLDGPVLLGTGGALKRALPQLGSRFFIMYGDSYLEPPMEAIAACFDAAVETSGARGLMTVYRNDGLWDRSNIEFVDGMIRRYDKQALDRELRHIDWGLGMLDARALAPWPDGTPFDLAQIYAQLLQDGRLIGFETFERFYEIGSHAGHAETDRLLRSRTTGRAAGRHPGAMR